MVPPEWWIYLSCTYPSRVSGGQRPPLTVDEIQGLPQLPPQSIYNTPLSPEDAWRVARLCGDFGYTYEQARTFSPDLADWFFAFREETGI